MGISVRLMRAATVLCPHLFKRRARQPCSSQKHEKRLTRTCRMLSSATLATTQSSLGFQAKSEILEVWPP